MLYIAVAEGPGTDLHHMQGSTLVLGFQAAQLTSLIEEKSDLDGKDWNVPDSKSQTSGKKIQFRLYSKSHGYQSCFLAFCGVVLHVSLFASFF